MKTLTVRDLLMESKVSDNLSSQIERLNELAKTLKGMAENVKTVNGLTESTDDTSFCREQLRECSTLFAKAKMNLREAKKKQDISSIHENVKLAYNIMNDIEDNVFSIEESLHETIDVLEESEQ